MGNFLKVKIITIFNVDISVNFRDTCCFKNCQLFVSLICTVLMNKASLAKVFLTVSPLIVTSFYCQLLLFTRTTSPPSQRRLKRSHNYIFMYMFFRHRACSAYSPEICKKYTLYLGPPQHLKLCFKK